MTQNQSVTHIYWLNNVLNEQNFPISTLTPITSLWFYTGDFFEEKAMSESSPYKQIIPATDWYFRHDNVSGVTGKSTLYQLAAWALKENGEVVGLVTVRDDNGRPKLVTPPPVPGDYLHKEQLTDDEKEWAKRR